MVLRDARVQAKSESHLPWGEDMATLEVADSGVGLPEDFTPSGSTSMGMDIVSVLAEQLDGTLRHRNEAGAVFSIEFPKGSIQ